MLFGEVDWSRRLSEANARGELLDAETFMARMGWNRAQLDGGISKHRVFLIRCDHSEYVPSFFFDAGSPRHQVQLVSAALGAVSPGGKWQFFVTGKGSLGGISPLAALARGQLRAVRHAALAFAER